MAVFLFAGCTAVAPAPNILIILIDTLRADRVGWAGSSRQLTPFLDSLATRGDVFANAYAQSSWTSPSVASLLTSRYQSQHGVVRIGSVLPASETTLAEVVRRFGYRSAGFSANPLIAEKWGYAKGFEHFEAGADINTIDNPGAKERAEDLNRACLSWLDGLPSDQPPRPVFLYLQYMEPHAPYFPPQDALERILRREADPEAARRTLADILFTHQLRLQNPDPEALRVIEDLYDAEVLALDEKLRELFSALRSRRFLDNAVVVITADHGEELMEHGRIGHGFTLFNEVIHVPLLIAAPTAEHRKDIQTVVSLVDIAPTVLDFAGIARPPPFEGHSLRAAMEEEIQRADLLGMLRHFVGPAGTNAPVAYSELVEKARIDGVVTPMHVRAVVMGDEKAIARRDGGFETYDMTADPGETNPTALSAADQQILQGRIEALRARLTQNQSPQQVAPLDQKTRERMRALGYL